MVDFFTGLQSSADKRRRDFGQKQVVQVNHPPAFCPQTLKVRQVGLKACPWADHQRGQLEDFVLLVPTLKTGLRSRKNIPANQKGDIQGRIHLPAQGCQRLCGEVWSIILLRNHLFQAADPNQTHLTFKCTFNLAGVNLAQGKTVVKGKRQRALDALLQVMVPVDRHNQDLIHLAVMCA